ncbi:DUF932 domain-containing protein [Candidatus Aerophobetes bacterium]|nr:DUF932 domain-containing protein [Candidatus Aerophobetes bacterium]
MENGKFGDLVIDTPTFEVEAYKKSIVFQFEDGTRLIFARKSLTQLLHLVGVKRRDFEKHKDILKEHLKDIVSKTPLFVGYARHQADSNVLFAFRVTSEEYVPVPHRILFDFVRGVIKDSGFSIKEERWIKYQKRTGKFFVLHEVPLRYAREGDYLRTGILVTNANTGKDSIRCFFYGEILKCRNGVVKKEFTKKIAIIHRGTVETVLQKVAEAIKEILGHVFAVTPKLAREIEKLQEEKLSPEIIRNWLKAVKETLPKKYQFWLEKELKKNRKVFGDTKLALFQTVTAIATKSKNVNVSRKFEKLAHEILVEV